jgi:hypothetical protein
MRRYLLTVLIIILMPASAYCADGIWNLTGGFGIAFSEDRSAEETRTLGVLIMTPSYRSEHWAFSLDLSPRWNFEGTGFLEEEWKRKGDFIRPLNELTFKSGSGSFNVGLATVNGLSIGSRQLVRGVRGDAEFNYVLPGFIFNGTWGKAEFEMLVDRVVDPQLTAVAFKYRPKPGTAVVLESAVDPDAPIDFTNVFEDGRPKADTRERVAGHNIQGHVRILNRRVLDMWIKLNSGSLGRDSAGKGGSLMVELDFSQFYLNRLTIEAGTVQCDNGYVPAYFDELYLLERWGLTGGGATQRKLFPQGSTAPDRRMDSIWLRYAIGEHFSIETSYDRFDDNSMRRSGLSLKLLEEDKRGLEADIWSRAFGEDQTLFSNDGDLFTRIGALYSFLPHLLLKFSLQHSWVFDETAGGLVPTTDVLIGTVYSISL